MPAARGVKRSASKASTATASTASKNKKKRGAIQLEIPSAPKKRGCLFVCGQGDVGQLGLGEDVPETSKFKNVTKLGDKIVDACAGGMHTIALDSDGKVWTFGCNDEGALGRITSSDEEEGTPSVVKLPAKAVCISAGDSHSAALLNTGEVYAWGAFRDSHGSMGLVMSGREGKSCKEPVKVNIGETAVAIASGGDHLVILSSTGGVYTMGCGEQGQLGRLSQRSASRDARQGFSALLTPSKLTLKFQASRVWAGYHATFIMDAADKMYACGLNNYSQLGVTGEKRKTALFSPTECDAFTSCNSGGWRQVSCGQHHSLALDTNGQVYSIGRCEYGRLGLGDRQGDAEILEAVPKLRAHACVSVAAGTSNSFAVTDAGLVFAWGMGSEGQLGTGGDSDQREPAPAHLPHHAPLRAAAGGQHSLVLAVDPNQKEPTPEPVAEEDVPMEANVEEVTEKEKEKEKPQRKRQRKNEQEDEISSTSGASKLNGDENKDSAMEVDETDKPQNQDDDKMDTDKESDNIEVKPNDAKPVADKPNASEKPSETSEKHSESSEKPSETSEKPSENEKASEKPDNTDTSSQDTTESETKDESKAEVNGTPETKVIETKSVELETSTPLTTSA